jgi:hypothetical protein
MNKRTPQLGQTETTVFGVDDLVEYHGRKSKNFPRKTVMRVCGEATATTTVVEARTDEGEVTQIVLATKNLKRHTSLF